MLSAVLRSDIAIQVSIRIMETFIEMRKFMTNSPFLYERLNEIEAQQSNYQKETNVKFEQVFTYIEDRKESNQKIFFSGHIYDAYSLIIHLIENAAVSITLVDSYVNLVTLDMLSKKNEGVAVCLYTAKKTALTEIDVDKFNQQYPSLEIRYTSAFHDRFLIIDENCAYHIGASIKDAGKKCFAITKLEDVNIVQDLIRRLESQT